MVNLYNELLNKFTVGIYGRRPNPIGEKMDSAKNTFTSYNLDNKQSGKPTREGGMQISKKIDNTTSMYLINQSPTGLFETKIDLQTI